MDNGVLEKVYARLNAQNEVLLPLARDPSAIVTDKSWRLFNDDLTLLTGLTRDYYYQKLEVTLDDINHIVLATDFSSSVFRAVKYFYETQNSNLDIQPPISPSGNWSGGSGISQTVNNHQTTEINIEFNQTLSYVSESIGAAKNNFEIGSNEQKFLDKVREIISTVKSSADIVKMIIVLAAEFGISADTLKEIFK